MRESPLDLANHQNDSDEQSLEPRSTISYHSFQITGVPVVSAFTITTI